MDMTLFGSLVVFTLVGGVTPGPNNIILMSQGLLFGFRRCIPYILGVSVGFASLMISAILGLGALIATVPILISIVTVLGALWLLYLAWGFFKAGIGEQSEASENDAPVKTRPLGFKEAVAFQWVNPKGLIFALGAAAGYVNIHENLAARTIIITATFLAAGFIGNALWAGAGGAINRWLTAGRLARALNIGMSLIIVLTAGFILKSGLNPPV